MARFTPANKVTSSKNSGFGSFKNAQGYHPDNPGVDPRHMPDWGRWWDPKAPSLPVPRGPWDPKAPYLPVPKKYRPSFAYYSGRTEQGGDTRGSSGSGIRGDGMGSNYGPSGYQGGTYGGAGGPSITEGVGGAYKNR